jgi:hypothetical protein
LQGVDVLILNEADWGMKRTEYRDVTQELAAALHMNYAYGVEFVEVDPLFDLGTEQVQLTDAQEEQRLQQDLSSRPSALSRFAWNSDPEPVSRSLRARIHRLPVCYDWYNKEYSAISKLENGRRWSAQQIVPGTSRARTAPGRAHDADCGHLRA